MSEEHNDVVEIDAIAVEEWDREQHTPVQVESNLAELVKKSGLDEAWEAPGPKDEAAAAPRTTTNTLRRTASAPALPTKVHKTMAMPTVAVVKPAPPAKPTAQPAAAVAKPAVIPAKAVQAVQPAAPKAKLEAKTAPTKPATKTTATRAALAKPAAAPTFSPFGNAAAPAKAETTKSAPAATPPAAARRDATPAKVETIKSVPVATPPAAARRDATPAKVETIKSAPVTAKAPAEPVPRPPSALELPVWPPAAAAGAPSATSRAVTAKATPRVDVASLAAGAQQAAQYDDWDEVGGATSVGNRDRTQPPPRAPGEDSVIIDLNAVSQTPHQPSRRPQTYPILTSEQGTTTSGAFVMPTVGEPIAAQPAAPQPSHRSEKPTSPSMPAAAGAANSASAGVSAANGSGASSTAWHTPLPLAAPPPEPAPQWPSAAGLEYNGAHGSAPEIPLPVTRQEPTDPHLVRRTLLATVFPTPKSRKRGLLVAAGALAVILVIVLVSAGGSSKSTTDTTAGKANRTTPTGATTPMPSSSSTATSNAAAPSHAAAAAPVATADTVDTAAISSPTTTSSQPTTKKPVVAKRRISRGKKPVIVDYDKKPDPTPEQDEALSHARADYATGNHHLFAGETDAAIASYRQALAAYPNYVAGYRGLGLAFAQQGNRASALLAFKTYVKLAPTAKDVALINKRIANLSLR